MPRKLTGRNVTVRGRDAYKMEYGVYPRGTGNWAFKIGDDTYWPGPLNTYSEAKIKAQEEAASRGISAIRVLT